jgi:hypothetical protein
MKGSEIKGKVFSKFLKDKGKTLENRFKAQTNIPWTPTPKQLLDTLITFGKNVYTNFNPLR